MARTDETTDNLEQAEEALSRAHAALDRAAGELRGIEHSAALELRADVDHTLRRLRNLRVFAGAGHGV